jgi:hypothetical protein
MSAVCFPKKVKLGCFLYKNPSEKEDSLLVVEKSPIFRDEADDISNSPE